MGQKQLWETCNAGTSGKYSPTAGLWAGAQEDAGIPNPRALAAGKIKSLGEGRCKKTPGGGRNADLTGKSPELAGKTPQVIYECQELLALRGQEQNTRKAFGHWFLI